MKRFDFPLERVRRWRSEQMSVEELKLQQVRAEMAALDQARREIETDRGKSEQQVFSQPYIEPALLAALDSYRQYVAGTLRQLDARRQQSQSRMVQQMNRVIEARRRFELLDQLRKKAVETWQAALDKEQEDLAAELFLARSRRKQ